MIYRLNQNQFISLMHSYLRDIYYDFNHKINIFLSDFMLYLSRALLL